MAKKRGQEPIEQTMDRLQQAKERLEQAAIDIAASFPPTQEWAARRRQRGGWGRFALGLLAGSGTGAALGLLVTSRAGDGGADAGTLGRAGEAAGGVRERALRAFERGRSAAADSAGAVGDAATGGTVQVKDAAGNVASSVAAPPRSALDSVKARWREAMSDGKAAAAEKEREMRRRYLEDTKRL